MYPYELQELSRTISCQTVFLSVLIASKQQVVILIDKYGSGLLGVLDGSPEGTGRTVIANIHFVRRKRVSQSINCSWSSVRNVTSVALEIRYLLLYAWRNKGQSRHIFQATYFRIRLS